MRTFILFLLCMISFDGYAQNDSVNKLIVSGYIETYYSYDFAKPKNIEKPDYNYNYKRHNQLNVNLAYVKANYQSRRLRSNVALMTGNYTQYNLSAEPNWAKPLLEANIGFKPFKQHNFWIDAGVMPSHIGFESAVGADCWNLTRSLLAENSPYYESGIKFNYTNNNEKLSTSFYLLNGWQKIELLNRRQQPSIGAQVNYKFNNRFTLNYSNFIGRVNQDSSSAFRTFHNFYSIYEATPSLSFILGFDLGTQKANFSSTSVWYTPVLISKLILTRKSRIAGRIEYYSDRNQVIITTATPKGYQTFGASVNYDLQITPKVLWRAELKKYNSKDPIFKYDQLTSHQTTATLALIVKL